MKKYKKVIVFLVAVIISVFFTGCNDNTIEDEIHIHISDDKNSSSTEKTSVAKNSPTVTTIITTTVNITEQVLNEASLYAEKGNYIPAIDCIHSAQKTYGDNDAYSEALENYYVSYKVLSINAADDLAINGDYLQAIKVINKTSEIIGSNDELTAKITDYENSYALSVISSADEAVSSLNYNKATEIIENAMKQISDNALLTGKLNEINSKKPVDLMETNILYDGTHMMKITPDGNQTFSMGSNTYNSGFTLTLNSYYNDDTIALFDLKGKYSSITFKTGRTNNSEIADATLQVFLDGELSQDYSLDAKTPVNSLDISLNNANYMQLVLKLKKSCYSSVPYGFADIMLWPAKE